MPYLLQRISKPYDFGDGPLGKAHRAFGGGMLGLSDKAWDIIDTIWNIDYMGSAEFEFGELPQCLMRMAKNSVNLQMFSVKITGSKVKRSWLLRGSKAKIPSQVVYVVATKEQVEDIKFMLPLLAQDKFRLKEGSLFNAVLQCDLFDKEDTKYLNQCGWVDIQHDYMFFTDIDVYTATMKTLFDLEYKPVTKEV